MANKTKNQDESRTKLSPLEIKNLAEKVANWKKTTSRYTSGGHVEVPGSGEIHNTITYLGKIDRTTIGAYYGDPGCHSWAKLEREEGEPIELGRYNDSPDWWEPKISKCDKTHVRKTYQIAERKYQEQEQAREKIEAELKAEQEAAKRNITAEAVGQVRKMFKGKI